MVTLHKELIDILNNNLTYLFDIIKLSGIWSPYGIYEQHSSTGYKERVEIRLRHRWEDVKYDLLPLFDILNEKYSVNIHIICDPELSPRGKCKCETGDEYEYKFDNDIEYGWISKVVIKVK